MDPVEALREDHDVPVEHERVEVSREDVRRIRAAVERGVDHWVGAVVGDGAGRVLLVRNRWSDGWVPPGGKVEPGETLQAAAVREVREETGVAATLREPVTVVEQTFTCGGDAVAGHYVAFAATAEGTALAEAPGVGDAEIEAVDWFDDLPADVEHRETVERGRAALDAARE